MPLEKLTLESLERTKLKNLFDNSMGEVLQSLCHQSDVPGDRSINIKITFKPKDGFIMTNMECTHTVPGRKVSTMAKLEDDQSIKIDTTSGDARQVGLEFPGNEKVTPITAARKDGAAS